MMWSRRVVLAVVLVFVCMVFATPGTPQGWEVDSQTSLDQTPARFFAAIPPASESTRNVLRARSDTTLTGRIASRLGTMAVEAVPGAEVVFWAVDHGSFAESGREVASVTADEKGIARATFHAGPSRGLYRVSVASRGAHGRVHFFCFVDDTAGNATNGGDDR